MLTTEKLLKLINELPDVLNLIKENNPSESDTVGLLIDKLSSVTIQMWHNQEELYKIRKMNNEEFVEEYQNQLKVLHLIIKRCCDLNYQRSILVDAIDKKVLEIKNGYIR